MSATPETVAAMLAAIRRANRAARSTDGHPALAEVLLLIASGVDTIRDLSRVAGINEAETRRIVHTLEGRGRMVRGQVLHSAMALVRRRKHPHRTKQTHQLLLTAAGETLVSSTFAPTSEA